MRKLLKFIVICCVSLATMCILSVVCSANSIRVGTSKSESDVTIIYWNKKVTGNKTGYDYVVSAIASEINEGMTSFLNDVKTVRPSKEFYGLGLDTLSFLYSHVNKELLYGDKKLTPEERRLSLSLDKQVSNAMMFRYININNCFGKSRYTSSSGKTYNFSSWSALLGDLYTGGTLNAVGTKTSTGAVVNWLYFTLNGTRYKIELGKPRNNAGKAVTATATSMTGQQYLMSASFTAFNAGAYNLWGYSQTTKPLTTLITESVTPENTYKMGVLHPVLGFVLNTSVSSYNSIVWGMTNNTTTCGWKTGAGIGSLESSSKYARNKPIGKIKTDGTTSYGVYLSPDYLIGVRALVSSGTNCAWTPVESSSLSKKGIAKSYSSLASGMAQLTPSNLLLTKLQLGYFSEFKPVADSTSMYGAFSATATDLKRVTSFSTSSPLSSDVAFKNIASSMDLKHHMACTSYMYLDITTGTLYRHDPSSSIDNGAMTRSRINGLLSGYSSQGSLSDYGLSLSDFNLYNVRTVQAVPLINTSTSLTKQAVVKLPTLVPNRFMEAVVINKEVQQNHIAMKVSTYVATGRYVNLKVDSLSTVDMTTPNKDFAYSSASTEPCKGTFFGVVNDIGNMAFSCVMTTEGILLASNGSTYSESGLSSWLQGTGVAYVNSHITLTGFDAPNLLRVINSAVSLDRGNITNFDFMSRLDEISSELGFDKSDSVIHFVFSVLAFLGILMMVYAVALILAYCIDMFNTFSDVSILNIITFGGLTPVSSREELEFLCQGDASLKRKYITVKGVLWRAVICTLIGAVLINSGQVYVTFVIVFRGLQSVFNV